MNRYILTAILFAGIIGIGVSGVSYAQESIEIPKWVKDVADLWVQGVISDDEFIEGLEFLIDSNIIQLGESEYRGISEMEQEFQEKLDEQDKEWQEKLDVQLKKKIGENYKNTKDWEKQSNEYDQKIVDLDKRYDDKVAEMSKERKQQKQELEDKIKELKSEISQLKAENRQLK